MANPLIWLELLTIVRTIVERKESENPGASGPTKLEQALQDIEIIAAGLGEAWDSIKPAVTRMIAATVNVYNRIGKFKSKNPVK